MKRRRSVALFEQRSLEQIAYTRVIGAGIEFRDDLIRRIGIVGDEAAGGALDMAEAIFGEGIDERALAACRTMRVARPVCGIPSFGDADLFDFAAQRLAVSLDRGERGRNPGAQRCAVGFTRPQGQQDIGSLKRYFSLAAVRDLGIEQDWCAQIHPGIFDTERIIEVAVLVKLPTRRLVGKETERKDVFAAPEGNIIE